MTVRRAVRIANTSGFYGDRSAAMGEMLAGPDPVDVLTGDYLAELTMLILWKARRRDPSAGYATTFLRQMEASLGDCLARGIRVVSNAGGLNPHGLAARLREVATTLGLEPRIAVVDGDDVVDRLALLQAAGEELRHLDRGITLAEAGIEPVTANAYLGGFGIAAALGAGADIVVTGRVTDAALVAGPAAWWHGWSAADLDALAGAVVAGHVIECGPQATGGNYAFSEADGIDGMYPGFPIAEVSSDGTSVITKQPGTGGRVTVGTVTAQLLYEIAEPAYANPDVIARFDTIELSDAGPDRVRIGGALGEAPTGRLKVALNHVGGFRNSMGMVLTGLDQDAKARRAIAMLESVLGGWEQFAAIDIRRVGSELRITVKDRDRDKVGRRFSNAVMELLLASYAGAYATSPPSDATEFGVYWPTTVDRTAVEHRVTLPDGSQLVIHHADPVAVAGTSVEALALPAWSAEPTEPAPLGRVCGGRSGDKGGNANLGVWTRTLDEYRWMAAELTVERFRELLPECRDLDVRRYELPNLFALNFVVVGLLGDGVASSVRPDAQAKAFAEELRAQVVDIPVRFLGE